MPVIDHKLKMIPCSDIVSYLWSWHVGATHDSDEHVEHVNNHHECWKRKNKYQVQSLSLVPDEETIVIEFSKL